MKWQEIPLDPDQIEALAKLEAAFRHAKRAGLYFAGMDDVLLVFLAVDDRVYREEHPTAITHDVLSAIAWADVKTHGAYRDSGGW